MHVEAKINRAAVNLNQADPLLHHIVLQTLAMPGPQHAHQAVKTGEAKQHIFAVPAVTGKITFFREIGQPVNSMPKASRRRFVIHEMMAVQHITHLLCARIAMRFRHVTVGHTVIFQQAVNIRLIEKAPVEIRNLLPHKPFTQLVDIR
ncbi:hypothetical protein D3C71_1774390 [compost metagenome]